MAIQTGQDKLNQALHNDSCTNTWTLRVNDPCNAEKLDAILLALGGAVNVTQTIYNIEITSTDTEQSLVLPATVFGYMIKSRDKSIIRLSHVLGESGTTFITIKGGAVYTNEHRYSGLTLYFQSPTLGAIVEVVAWS